MPMRQTLHSILGGTLLLCASLTGADDYPAALAAELSQLPGSTVQQAIDLDGSLLVFLACGATPPAEVYTYYLEQAKAKGWVVGDEAGDEDHRTFSASKGTRTLMVDIAVQEGTTMAGITLPAP